LNVSGKEGAPGIDAVQKELLLLGFDARLAPAELNDLWPFRRKREALLRLDVRGPLSVDYLVWPTTRPLDDQTLGWRGPVQVLWDDINSLEIHLESAPGRWWIVAAALELRSVPPAEQTEWRKRVTGMKAGPEWKNWKRLGYDVADRFLTSSTLWFRPGESAEALRSEWGPHLNEHHLFSRFEAALEFRDRSNIRAPEHAPHYVYELFLGGEKNVGV
jgi:hypothetical protein